MRNDEQNHQKQDKQVQTGTHLFSRCFTFIKHNPSKIKHLSFLKMPKMPSLESYIDRIICRDAQLQQQLHLCCGTSSSPLEGS